MPSLPSQSLGQDSRWIINNSRYLLLLRTSYVPRLWTRHSATRPLISQTHLCAHRIVSYSQMKELRLRAVVTVVQCGSTRMGGRYVFTPKPRPSSLPLPTACPPFDWGGFVDHIVTSGILDQRVPKMTPGSHFSKTPMTNISSEELCN